MLAVSDLTEILCIAAQVIGIAVPAIVGRFVLKSRGFIWGIAFMGAFAAMIALMLVDGQGAFLMIMFAPMIYVFAVAGRTDLKEKEGTKLF